jgi:hypothetical protein
MKSKPGSLEMRKALLRLQLEARRLELEADVDTLRNPLRKAAIGAGVLQLLRTHPVIVTAAGALLTRIPRLGFAIKLAAGGVAAWQVFRLFRSRRRSS